MSKVKSKPKRAGRPVTIGASSTVIIRLQPRIARAIDAWAASAKVSRSEAVRQLIEAGLQKAKRGG